MSLDDLDSNLEERPVRSGSKSMMDLTAGECSTPIKTKTVSDERWSELAKKYGKSTEKSPFTGLQSQASELSMTMNNVNIPSNPIATTKQWISRTNDVNNSSKTNITSTVLKSPEKRHSIVTATSKDVAMLCMREKKPGAASSRPSSLVETDTGKQKLWEHAFGECVKLEKSEKTRGSSDTPLRAVPVLSTTLQKSPNIPLQDVVNGRSRRSTSFNDLRLIFENQAMTLPSRKLVSSREPNVSVHGRDVPNHMRMSSLDSTASDSDVGTPIHYGSTNSLGSTAVDHYGSITSLASSTSLISPQELQQLIDEANQSLEESGTPSHEITVVVLQREIPGGSIGITLAGGADYDCKEITVNKVIAGSLADRDGRIQKGDRVLSINGKNLKGIKHREALCILKAPRTDCVLVLSRSKSMLSSQEAKENGATVHRVANGHSKNYHLKTSVARHYSPASSQVVPALHAASNTTSHSRVSTEIVKDGSGLGFSLEGGKDSPMGDRPLTIKKIFTGGAADKNSSLNVGDEVLSIHGTDVTKMARIEAWNFMRKLPDGVVTLVINHQG